MLRQRNPDQTRESLLDAAAQEIHQHGFQAASLKRILENTGFTKGALYHHFPTKQALGYAVVEERLSALIREIWIEPLRTYQDPIEGMKAVIHQARSSIGDDTLLTLGCPLNNLAQEMSSIDEGFRQRIHNVYTIWHRSIVEALCRGQGAGIVRDDIDSDSVAMFIISTIEGAVGMAKNAQRDEILVSTMRAAFDYLDSIRT
jgi:TetR/AcrR family transcriptional repressor of nem operon